jgi:geranylgeranyl diphosphate synthase type II
MAYPSEETTVATAVLPQTEKKDKRASTAHLKIVPETRELRDRIRAEAARWGQTLDRSAPLTKANLQKMGEEFLQRMGLGEQYLGFTLVALTNEFWREQVQAVDFKRRLLLLPHCLKHAEGCPADYDEFGLDCKKCGACSVADFKVKAEELGYKVLVSEGCHCRRRVPQRSGEGPRQGAAGRHPLRGRAAVVEQLPEHQCR